jgi:hypothetical protein
MFQTLSLGAVLHLRRATPKAASRFAAANSPAARVPSKKTSWTNCPTSAQIRARSRRTRPKCPRPTISRSTAITRSLPILSKSSTNSSSRYVTKSVLAFDWRVWVLSLLFIFQVHLALKHLKDVVSKNKLEMLPGNGTIVLEIVTNIVANLRNYFIDEQR